MRILARFMLSASDLMHFLPRSAGDRVSRTLERREVELINTLVGAKLARTSNTPDAHGASIL